MTLVTNGRIYLDMDAGPVDFLFVADRRVQGWGSGVLFGEGALPRDSLDTDGSNSQMIDLRGGIAIPGLQDAHGHIEGLGEALENVDLVGCPSFAELVARVHRRAAHEPPGTWILGRGWDHTLWGSDFPRHDSLSAATPDHPVFLERVDGHAALVNARALELAGLTGRPLPEIEGGKIVVDESEAPTGVLVDAAMALPAGKIPLPDRAARRRRILLAQDALLRAGLTTVHDMGVGAQTAAVLEELEAEGLLHLRVIAYLWANEGLAWERQELEAGALPLEPSHGTETPERYPRPCDADPARKLRFLGAKLMIDGALGSRGAALLEPYADAPGESGLLQMTPEVYARRLRAAVDAGLQPATHAIGDRGNRVVLDAYERELRENPRLANLRPRIEHAQVVASEDWPRFERLGVIPSMQPTHATSDMRWAEARVGPERVLGAYAWKRLRGPHAPLAFGSDFPVESSNPCLGLYAARTRQDALGSPPGGWLPDQCLDAREALAAFTSGAAWAAHEEGTRGKLGMNYFADLTVLDVDPLTCAPEELLRARVLLTIIDGQVVYESEEYRSRKESP